MRSDDSTATCPTAGPCASPTRASDRTRFATALRSVLLTAGGAIALGLVIDVLRDSIATPIDRVATLAADDDGPWIDGSLTVPRRLTDGTAETRGAHVGHERPEALAVPAPHDGDGRRALALDTSDADGTRALGANDARGARPWEASRSATVDGAVFGHGGTICHQALPCDWDGDGRVDLVLALTSSTAWRDRNEVVWLRNVATDGERRYERGRTLVAWSNDAATTDGFVVVRRGELPPTGASWRVDVRDATGDGRMDLLLHDGYTGLFVLEQEVERSAAVRERLDRVQRARDELDRFWFEEGDLPSASRERRLERLQRELDEAEAALDDLGVDAARAGGSAGADTAGSGPGGSDPAGTGATSGGSTWVLEREPR